MVQQEVLDKVIGVAKTGIKGSRDLFISEVAAKCIGLVGVPVTARLMGAWDYGTYRKIMIPISLFMVLADLGMTTAITRYISYYESKGLRNQGKRYLTAGATIIFVMTLCMASFMSLFSRQISMSLFHEGSYASLIEMSSLLLIADMTYSVSEAAFLGMRKTGYLIIARPFRSAIKNLSVISAILLGYGVPGALEALIFSEFMAALLCAAFLARERYLSLEFGIGRHVKELVSYGLPLYAIGLSVTTVSNVLNWMLAYFVPNDVYGLYSVAVSVVSIFQTLISPIRRSLLPAFSDSSVVENMSVARVAFKHSIRYISLFVLPLTFAFITFAEPIVLFLFGPEYLPAGLYVKLYMLGYLFVSVGSWTIASFLRGYGDTRTVLNYGILDLLLLPLTYFMTDNYGIVGFLVARLLVEPFSWSYALYLVRKRYGLSPDFCSSGKIMLASLISSAIGYMCLKFIPLGYLLSAPIGLAAFTTVYLTLLPLLRVINRRDLTFLDRLLEAFKLKNKITSVLLSLGAKMLEWSS